MDPIHAAISILSTAQKIVTFSGAGLSAESGIPTFREAQTGYWARYDPAELASPGGFSQDPELVINWYNDRRSTIAQAQPNAAHRALAGRQDIVHVTQNIDHLLETAGAKSVLHLHGRIDSDRCNLSCGYAEPIDIADPPGLRNCPDCRAALRPSVVWFGEPLPQSTWDAAVQAVSTADVLLVVGTSGVVYPAASLVDLARSCGAAVVVVNTEPTRSIADVALIGPATELVPRLLTA